MADANKSNTGGKPCTDDIWGGRPINGCINYLTVIMQCSQNTPGLHSHEDDRDEDDGGNNGVEDPCESGQQ